MNSLRQQKRNRSRRIPMAVIIGLALAVSANAATNIDTQATGNKYGWTTAGTWINLQGDRTSGVVVTPDYLYGYAWWQGFGWVHFGDGSPENGVQYGNDSATDYGVNNDGLGRLSGFAWSESAGWINFETGGAHVTVSPISGEFAGFAWCEAGIWIAFTGFPDHVAVTDPQFVSRRNRTRHWSLYR